MKKKLLITVPIGIIVLIQFFRIDTQNPAINLSNDFLNLTVAPTEIQDILSNSCYDCHSYQTKYPWYSNVAPVSWMLSSHIREGRGHLNFSEWNEYSSDKQISLKEECLEEIQSNNMPLKSYTLIHKGARLSDNSKQILVDWLKNNEQTGGAKK